MQAEKLWRDAVDIFDFMATLAEYGNWKTMLKYNIQVEAMNIFHGMSQKHYCPGAFRNCILSYWEMGTVVMRYLGSEHFRGFPGKQNSNFVLFQQIVGDLMELWGYWSGHSEFHPYILRALHRTEQLPILMTAPKYDEIIPAFLRYAEVADAEHRRKEIKPGTYGEFDPQNPLALLETHRDMLHTGYMLPDVLRVILLCYFRLPRKDWYKYLKS